MSRKTDLSCRMYKYLRWTITANRNNINVTQMSEFEICDNNWTKMSRPSWTTITGNITWPSWETVDKIIDGSTSTKYCPNGALPVIITITLWESIKFDDYHTYKWYTANDESWRDPVSWTIEVSEDWNNWTTVDTVTNATITTTRYALAYTGTMVRPTPSTPQTTILDFQNNWLEWCTWGTPWSSLVQYWYESWQWVYINVTAGWYWTTLNLPTSIQVGTLKQIQMYLYVSNSNQWFWIYSDIFSFRYKLNSNVNYIWFNSWGSQSASIWSYTWEWVIDMNFWTDTISWTCFWVSYSITDQAWVNAVQQAWSNQAMSLQLNEWYSSWKSYIRKVIIKTE